MTPCSCLGFTILFLLCLREWYLLYFIIHDTLQLLGIANSLFFFIPSLDSDGDQVCEYFHQGDQVVQY